MKEFLVKKEVKVIFHIDLNAFFATVAINLEPYLKDRVFVVGGDLTSNRGVISTASYNARKYGINSGMSISDAVRLYPNLMVVPLNGPAYRKASNQFVSLLKQYSNIVLPASIDECYIDMTEQSKKRHPLEIAKEIQKRLLDDYKLPCSIGIAPTLFLAKMASDMKKPLGITVVRKRDVVEKIYPLPLKDLFGMGRKTYPLLVDKGIKTIGDFVKEENKNIVLSVISEGSYFDYLNHIMGKSSDYIDLKQHSIPKSISNEITLNYPLDDNVAILDLIHDVLDVTYRRLINEEMKVRTIGIKLKTTNFKLINRSITIENYTDDFEIIKETVEKVFETSYDNTPVRLVGVFFNNIMLKKDLKDDFNLFNYQKMSKREEALYKVIDEINKKIPNAVTLGKKK